MIALWGLAVAQPVLDVFGKNPEFFVANDLTTPDIVAFGLIVVLIGPVVLILLELVAHLIDPRAGRAVHALSVTVLGTALALTVLAQVGLDDAVIVVPTAAFLGVVVAYLEATAAPVRSLLRYLAFAPILFLAAFLGFSASAELLRGDPSAAIEPGRVDSPAPVVVLSLDEFPLASILRSDGTINEERFPNFARLAERSSWFRNATSAAATTTESVPATLTGVLPEMGQLPTYRDHPRSIFTLLGAEYPQEVTEQVTEVCPAAICPRDSTGLDSERLRTSLTDAAAVYGHVALPDSLRDHLPVIDRSWGGFIEGEDPASSGGLFVPSDAPSLEAGEDPGERYGDTARGLEPDPTCPDIELWCGAARVSELVEEIDAEDPPTLYLTHATIPHLPWLLSAQGHQYAPRSVYVDGIDPDGSWVEDPAVVRLGFQRHLLQVGSVDLLLGRLMDRLEAEGLWDDAVVVVVADHGVAFTPGAQLRKPEATTRSEIFSVPLFIKAPGQTTGEVRDDNALTVDVLPTIVDLLDIETDWTFDGTSLVGDEPHRADKPIVVDGVESFLPVDLNGILAVARRNEGYLPYGDDWLSVAAVGTYGDLVGQPVTGLDTSGGTAGVLQIDQTATLADWDPDGDALAPLLLNGHIDASGGSPPTEALVAVNGRVAGVAVDFRPSADGGADFRTLIAEELLARGPNAVALLVPTAPGSRQFRFVAAAG